MLQCLLRTVRNKPLLTNVTGWLAGTLALLGSARANAEVPRTAFHYGEPVPPELFTHFDRVVVDPAKVATPPEKSPRGEAFARIDLGELPAKSSVRGQVSPGAFLPGSADWAATVADLTKPEWHTFVLEIVLAPLWGRGFRNFYLDRLDSYERLVGPGSGRRDQLAGLATLLGKIVQKYPTAKLILHGAAEAVHAVRANVVGLTGGSLYHTWNPGSRMYQPVPEPERNRLLAQLMSAGSNLKVPVTVVDYAPRAARRDIAQKITAHGFDAWVSGPGLDEPGVGQTELVSRRVLMVYGGDQRLAEDDAHVVGAAIVERMGYAVDYISRSDPLPQGNLGARYAGVVTMLANHDPKRTTAYRAWLLDRVREGIPIALLSDVGFAPDAEFLRQLGLAPTNGGPSVKVVSAAPWATFETTRIEIGKPIPDIRAASPDVETFLRLEDKRGQVGDAIVIGPWGGLVQAPYLITGGDGDTRRYGADPWTFLAKALRLTPAPVLDVSTEGGVRTMIAHVDGDGFPSRSEIPGTPFAGQVVYDSVFSRFKIPTTVSVIEGEVGPTGRHKADSPALERIAQAIFRLPHVEIASHTYSHPFDWSRAERWEPFEGKVAHLPIEGYTFDLRRDLVGSVEYINNRLAPPGKKTKVFLWSGDCLPSRDAVALTAATGLWNVNGGGATQAVDNPSLTQLHPTMLPLGKGAIQVYAPVENDNIYTRDWLGPHYGYRRVMETLQLTESPRRLTPLAIYYHFFSATKTAGIKALVDIHTWAMAQETHPLYLSEYAERVVAFASASMSRRLDGTWEIVGLGPGRTLRVDPALGYPDMARSKGVAGVRDSAPGRYVILTGDKVEVLFRPEKPSRPYVERTNGQVVSFTHEEKKTKLRIRGNMPLAFSVGGAAACTLVAAGRAVAGTPKDGAISFSLRETDTGEASLDCR